MRNLINKFFKQINFLFKKNIKKNQKFQIIKNNKINMQKNQKTIFNKKNLKTKPKNTFKNRK